MRPHPLSRFAYRVSRFTSHISRFTFVSVLLALLLAATGWAPAPQEGGEEGGVVGRVTNGTPGGTVPADLPVTLHAFSEEGETATYTTTLAADGSFCFDDVAPEEGETLVARVVYQDVDYLSDPVALEPGQQELSLPLIIYETTEDPAAVQVTQLHLFLVRVGDDRLQVGEYYLVGNAGDRTYVGAEEQGTDQRATLTFTLPEGAENLRFDGAGLGERFLEREGTFADTRPVPPGSTTLEVSFGYELPYREGQRVERVFDMPVASLVLVPMEEDLVLEGEGLTLVDVQDTQMWPPVSYAAGPLAAGESLAFALLTRAQAAAPSAQVGSALAPNTAREISIGLVALGVAVVAVYLLWRSPAPGPLPARARPLVEAIAALDTDFEAGRVSERVYNRKRKALKRQLRALLREPGEERNGGAEEQRRRGAGELEMNRRQISPPPPCSSVTGRGNDRGP